MENVSKSDDIRVKIIKAKIFEKLNLRICVELKQSLD